MEKINHFATSIYRKSGFRVFLTFFIFSFIIFLPATFNNGFALPMNGDYIVQQVPFYSNAHDIYWHFLRTGEITLYNYENFLGVNFFPANTFYYLTSPFSFLVILCPKSLIPQFIFFSMLLKMSLGGYFFYFLLRKYFNVSNHSAFIGGLIYAFCGWGMFYLWFNHLTDVLAIFPLTLIGAEHYLKKNKGWLLTLTLLIMGMTNFFFLFTFAITNSVYIFFRVLQTTRKQGFIIKIKKISFGALYFIIGLALSSFVLFPALSMLGGNPRLSKYDYLINLLRFFYPNASYTEGNFILGSMKSIGDILHYKNIQGLFSHLFRFKEIRYFLGAFSSFFFATWGNWDTLLYEYQYFDNVWSSMFITMPMIILLIPSLITSIKEKKILDIAIFFLLFTLPFAPIVYNSLHAFSQAYGRWQIFLVAMTLIYTIKKLDNIKSLTRIELFLGLSFTIFMMSIALYLSASNEYISEMRLFFGIGSVFYVFIIFAFYFSKDYNPHFKTMFIYLVMLELFVNANIAVNIHGYQNVNSLLGGKNNYLQQEALVKQMKAEDDQFYRVFNVLANRNNVNLPMALGYKGLSTFHSAYEYNLTEFINFARLNYWENTWSMGAHEKRFYLESFLNVKYYIINNPDRVNITFPNLPLDYEQVYCTYNFCLYKNNNHFELGTSYDNFISEEDFSFRYYKHDGDFLSKNYGHKTMTQDQTYLKYPIVNEKDVAELKAELNIENTELPANQFLDSLTNTTISTTTLQTVYKPYIWEESKYDNPQLFNGFPQVTTFNYNDQIDYVLSSPIPANSILNINLFYGPNMAITLYSSKSEMENFLATASLSQKQKNKIINTLNNDCHENYPDNKIYCQVTYDDHSINWYDKKSDHKFSRGFYTPLKIEKIQLKFQENTNLINYMPTYTYSDYNQYLAQMQTNKDNGFFNIEHSNNNISFETNYNSKRLVLLSIPFNEGFTIKVNNEIVKKYKLTSGFLGFVAPAGNANIKISFFTPGLNKGIKYTLIAATLLGAVISFEERKKIMLLIKKFSNQA